MESTNQLFDYFRYYYHRDSDEGGGNGQKDASSTRVCHEANSVNSHFLRTTVHYDELRNFQPHSKLDCPERVRVIVISDTHEAEHLLGQLPPCDILIHSGDILLCSRLRTSSYSRRKLNSFGQWFASQPAGARVIVPGNHDVGLEQLSLEEQVAMFPEATLLLNKGTTACGLAMWGSPASHGHSGNKAWQSREFRAEAHRASLAQPRTVDILVTHGPCVELRDVVQPHIMHVSGHVHAHHGSKVVQLESGKEIISAAAPIMNTDYIPQNHPVVIDICFCPSNCSESNTSHARECMLQKATIEQMKQQPQHSVSHLHSIGFLCTVT